MNENQDLEDFLASVSVPPPIQKVTPAMELTPEEIMAYIIPPPPERLNFDENIESSEETHNAINESNNSGSPETISSTLVKNKSTLHDVLANKNGKSSDKLSDEPGNRTESLKPLPRRSFDEKPPERPPKEFLRVSF